MGKSGCSSCVGKGCMGTVAVLTAWFALGWVVTSMKGCVQMPESAKDVIDKAKQTYQRVAEPQEKVTRPKVPTGSFKIDFQSEKGLDKRFEFDVRGRDENGAINVKIKEWGHKQSDLGKNARFNVVFWNAGVPEQKGLAFQVNLNRLGGVSIHPFNNQLRTIIISDGELICGRYNDNVIRFSPDPAPDLAKARVISQSEAKLPERLMQIDKYSVSLHNKKNMPLVVEPQVKGRPNER